MKASRGAIHRVHEARFHGGLAQLVEQPALNRKAVGFKSHAPPTTLEPARLWSLIGHQAR